MPKEEPEPHTEERIEPAEQHPVEKPVEEQVPAAAEHQAETIPDTKEKKSFKQKLGAFLKTKKGKVVAILLAVAVVIGSIFAIPATRYAVAGLVIKKDVTLQVLDKTTLKPVSGVQLTLAGQTVKTDGNGNATIKNVAVGEWRVDAKKNYYQDAGVTTLVPILAQQSTIKIAMVATGRQVPVTVINKVTGTALGGVEITTVDSSGTTDKDGHVVMVLPAGKDAVTATFKAKGYNNSTADITVTEQQDAKNTFAVTPNGKIYFLSKRTGKINVMKSDLDGANASVVVEATGKESETQTILLASRDWSYLALHAKRDSDDAKIYFVNTADDKFSVIDEGKNVSFTPVGWYNEHYIYKVFRGDAKDWQPGREAIKSFDAKTNKITTLYDTAGVGTDGSNWAHEALGAVYILENQVTFSAYWNNSVPGSALLAGKKDVFATVRPDGSDKQNVKETDATTLSYTESVLYKPTEVYYRISTGGTYKYYAYEDGKMSDTTAVNDNNFFDDYPTYLVSPSGDKTFWFEPRDGKNVFFVGDKQGANGKEVLVNTDYTPYGWFTDEYLLLSKGNSELYIMPRDAAAGVKPLKITDYHKPQFSSRGYGFGYGGF
jgi:hypothetical protein